MSSRRRRRGAARARAAYEGKVLYEFEAVHVEDRPPVRAPTRVHASLWSLLPVVFRRLVGVPPLQQS